MILTDSDFWQRGRAIRLMLWTSFSKLHFFVLLKLEDMRHCWTCGMVRLVEHLVKDVIDLVIWADRGDPGEQGCRGWDVGQAEASEMAHFERFFFSKPCYCDSIAWFRSEHFLTSACQ